MAYPIYPVEGTPYSNFHDLNLDWILQRVKEAYEAYKNLPDTVDQSVRAYMESDSFLDALRDIIDENFLTDAAEQAIKERLTTINVHDYGALGDGTDQTAQIQAAVAAFIADPLKDTIYFPSGTYKFNTQQIDNRPITIKGNHCTLTPIQQDSRQDPFYTMFKFYGNTYVNITGFYIRGYHGASSYYTGQKLPMEPVFLMEYCDEVIFDDLHFTDFYLLYHSYLGYGTLPMPQRGSLFIKAYGCQETTIDNCEFYGQLGGEEMILICSAYDNNQSFAYGKHTISNCYAHDRDMSLGYSTLFNVYGGDVHFMNNVFDSWAYHWFDDADTRQYEVMGSINNLMANNGVFSGNQFINCVGNCIDTSEGQRFINNDIEVRNNLCRGGIINIFMAGNMKQLMFSDNFIDAWCALYTYVSNGKYRRRQSDGTFIEYTAVQAGSPIAVGGTGSDDKVISNNRINQRFGFTDPTYWQFYAARNYNAIHLDQVDATYYATTWRVIIDNNHFTGGGYGVASQLHDTRYQDAYPAPIGYESEPQDMTVCNNRFMHQGFVGFPYASSPGVVGSIFCTSRNRGEDIALLTYTRRLRLLDNFFSCRSISGTVPVHVYAWVNATNDLPLDPSCGESGNVIESRYGTDDTAQQLLIRYTHATIRYNINNDLTAQI